jgi:cytochrome P450
MSRLYPIAGAVPGLLRDAPGYLAAMARRHGDLVSLPLFVAPHYLAAAPDDIAHVLVGNHAAYRKTTFYRNQLSRLVGNGLLTSDGDTWRRHRRLVAPTFQPARVEAMAPAIVEAGGRLVERWSAAARAGETLDVAAESMRVTLEIAARVLFGAHIGAPEIARIGEAITTALSHLAWRTFLPALPRWVPLPGDAAFRRAVATLDALVERLVAERRDTDTGDLLAALVRLRDESGDRLDARELRDEVVTLLIAGHETTALALTWTLHLLGQNPDAERVLHDEVDRVLGGRTPRGDDLPSLRWTQQTLKESMRLYPPLWAIGRTTLAPDEIGGRAIPAGAGVTLSPWVTHRHPALWRDAERFDPARFAPPSEAARPRFAYFPFGGGPRVCVGERLALLEGTLLLASIAQRFRLRPVTAHAVSMRAMVTLRPAHGIFMRVATRDAS